MNEYSDISFFANLDPFAKKKSKNDALKIVQKGHPILSSQETSPADAIVELSSFAQHKKFTGPKWMVDLSKWTSKNLAFSRIFELKVLQIIDEGVVDITLLMSIYESILFENRNPESEANETFISCFVNSYVNQNESYQKYVGWGSSSVFGSFTVENFQVANFITLKEISTHKLYHVYDNLGFSSLKIGQKLTCRIVKSQSQYIFTGGFVLVTNRGYCIRYHKDANTGSMYSNGVGIKVLKDELDLSTNYSTIYSYYRLEKEAISNASYFNELSFEDALCEMNYLIIKYNLQDYLNLNSFVQSIQNDTINIDRIKLLKNKVINFFDDYSDYNKFFVLLTICIKKHPMFLKEKIGNVNQLFFANQFWEDIPDLSLEKKNIEKIEDEIDLKASKSLLNISGNAIVNYNKSVDLVISKKSPIISLKMIVNSFRVSDLLSGDLMKRWYLTMSLNLVYIGEMLLAQKYFIEAQKLGAETSRYENYFINEEVIEQRKVIGRSVRFNHLSWGSLISNLLNNSDIVSISKSFLENLIEGDQIRLNLKGQFRDRKSGNAFINKILSDRYIYLSSEITDCKSLKDNSTIAIVFELLLSAGLIEIKEQILQVTTLGKIYFHTKSDNEFFELLLVTWFKLANWKNFGKIRNSPNLEHVISHIKSNVYRLFNFMYSKGTSSFTLSEIISVLSIEYIETENQLKRSKIISSKLWGKIFVKSIYEVLQLYGIMNIISTEADQENLVFKLTDDGIYILGKIESEIDKMIPLLARKIIT